MAPAVLPKDRSPGRSSKHPDGGDSGQPVSGIVQRNTILTFAAACVAPILYLLYVNHFAVNVLQNDDWSTVTLVNGALHGHLSWGQLWSQHDDSRVLLPNLVFVLFGFIDRSDLRSITFLSAAAYLAAYVGLLALLRRYMGKRLTPVPVLAVGLIWFSLADVQNSLWAFQLAWFLVVLFFVVTMVALLVPEDRRNLWFVVALVGALAASLSFLAGFIVWPMGAICILWARPWTRRQYLEIAAWVGTALVTLGVYSAGFNFNDTACGPGCGSGTGLHHPLATVRYFFVLIGSIIPKVGSSPVGNFDRFEWVGIAIFVVAMFIVVQSWRCRASQERLPLPLMLVGFSLCFDAMIALGRSAALAFAIDSNRYVMPNIFLVTGIVIYALGHRPPRLLPSAGDSWKTHGTRAALVALAAFVVVQVVVATGFGISNARSTNATLVDQARLLVNLDQVPAQDRDCELTDVMNLDLAPWSSIEAIHLRIAEADHLSQFEPAPYDHYRTVGPPEVPRCSIARSAPQP